MTESDKESIEGNGNIVKDSDGKTSSDSGFPPSKKIKTNPITLDFGESEISGEENENENENEEMEEEQVDHDGNKEIEESVQHEESSEQELGERTKEEKEEEKEEEQNLYIENASDPSYPNNRKKIMKEKTLMNLTDSDRSSEQDNMVTNKRLYSMKNKKKKKSHGKQKLFSSFLDTEAQVGDEEDEEYEEAYETVDNFEKKEAQELERKQMQDFLLKTSGTNHLAKTINKLTERYERDHKMLRVGEGDDMDYEEEDLLDDEILDGSDDLEEFSDEDLMPNIYGEEGDLGIFDNPKLWLIKLFRKNAERSLAISLFYKFLKCRTKENDYTIKGIYVSDNLKGYIYIEADSLYLLKKFLYGFRVINLNEISIVPVQELTSIFDMCQSTLAVPKIHEYVRIKKGLYANDIGQVYGVNERAASSVIRLIPRVCFESSYVSNHQPTVATISNLLSDKHFSILDKKVEGAKVMNEGNENARLENLEQNRAEGTKKMKEIKKEVIHLRNKVKKERPVKNFFNREKIENMGGIVRKGSFSDTYRYQNNIYDSEGYILKKMKNKFLIIENANITHAEMLEFTRNMNTKREFPVAISKNMMYKQRALLFRKNEPVKIIKGELMNLTGVVTDIKESSLVVRPDNFSKEFDFLPTDISKHFTEGDSVTVISGIHKGKSGLVSLLDYKKDIALVFCPCINAEFQTSIVHLCLSSQQLEEYAGVKTFNGYSIGDLIEMSDHQIGILTYIDKNKNARVLTYDNEMVHTTISTFTNKRSSFGQVCRDLKFNIIQAKDKIMIHKGSYRGKLGQVLHVWKNKVFVKINTKVQDYGMAVLDGESFVLSGNPHTKRKLPLKTNPNNNMFKQNNAQNYHHVNPYIGKTVKILKGMYKGLFADVIDAQREEFTLLLKIKPKTVRQKKIECVIVDSCHGQPAMVEEKKGSHSVSKETESIVKNKEVFPENDLMDATDFTRKKPTHRERDFVRKKENNNTQALYIGTDGRMKDRKGMEDEAHNNEHVEMATSIIAKNHNKTNAIPTHNMNTQSPSKNHGSSSSIQENHEKRSVQTSMDFNKLKDEPIHKEMNNDPRNGLEQKMMETNWDDEGINNKAKSLVENGEKTHIWTVEGVLVQVIVSGRFCNQIGVIKGVSARKNFEVVRVQTETATFNIVAEALVPLHPKRINDSVIVIDKSTHIRGKVLSINGNEVKVRPTTTSSSMSNEISAQMENVFACVNEDDLLKIIK